MSIASDSTSVRLSPAVRKKLRQQEANQAIIQRSIELIQLQTGDSWTIHVDAKKGRAGIARVDIPLGTTIVHEHAAGWVLSSDAASNGHYCRHCCKNYDTPPKFPPCCIYTSYCSDQCLALDSRLHSYTCPVLPLIPHWAAQSQADPDLLRLVAHTLAGWFIEQEENMNKSQQASSSSSSSPPSSSSSLSPSRSPSAPKARWSNVQDLISNIESADKSWMASVTSAMTSLRQEYEKQEKFKGMDIPTVQTLVELCSRINSNSHAIFDISSSSNSVIGLGLFPTTSILNHSCAPNSFFSCGASGEMFVRTVRDVKKGEELTVPYVDLYQARWERMKELWSDKVFICTCDRCRYEEKAPKSFASESTITAAQLADWNQVGGIYCTECTAKAAEESLNEMSFDDAKKGKKKKKAKAATESSSDNSTASASSSSSSSTSSSFYPFLPSLPPPPANIGLLTWRGTGMDEIRPVSTPAQESSVMSRVSWACDRKGCTAKWSHQQVNERLQPIVDLYRQAAELKQSRKLEQALVGYEKMIHELSAYVPPLHALYISALSPALNISLYLARQTSSLARWSASEQFAAGILTRMQRVFPRNWLETSNFYIVLAEAIDEQAKLTTNETTKKELENRRNLAYQEAHRIRSIVCGPQHPRTLSTPTPFREEKK